MDLLFKRAQTMGASSFQIPGLSLFSPRPKFKLWAKIECTPQEHSVISHYHFEDSVLVEGHQEGLMRRSTFIGFWSMVLATLFFMMLFSFTTSFVLGLITGGISGYLYYDNHREIVFVRDLLAGRHFTCLSVIDLAKKEAWLESITAFLRQVMESAKHWDGTEVRPVPVLDPEQAKQLISRGL